MQYYTDSDIWLYKYIDESKSRIPSAICVRSEGDRLVIKCIPGEHVLTTEVTFEELEGLAMGTHKVVKV